MTKPRALFAIGVLVALLLAGVVSGFASSSPDGLEKVAADTGFIDTEQTHGMADSPLAGYGVKGVGNERLSGGLAGVVGVLATLAVGSAVFWVMRRRSPGRPGGDHDGGDGSEGDVPSDRGSAVDSTGRAAP